MGFIDLWIKAFNGVFEIIEGECRFVPLTKKDCKIGYN